MAAKDTTNGASTTDYSDLEIVINPDDIVDALAADGKFPDRNGNMAVTVRPPFDGEARGETRFNETGTFWPPEMSPKPLDLSPALFHDAEFGYPERWQIADAVEDVADVENAHDAPDDVWNECRDVQVEVWEGEVRNTLKDEIDINKHTAAPREMVPVRYESGESQ